VIIANEHTLFRNAFRTRTEMFCVRHSRWDMLPTPAPWWWFITRQTPCLSELVFSALGTPI